MARYRSNEDSFHAIADPTRRRILVILEQGDRTVSEIADPFQISQPAISQHLRVLREAGLVEPQRVGRHQRYRLNAEALKIVYDWVGHFERFWDKKLKALGDYLGRTS